MWKQQALVIDLKLIKSIYSYFQPQDDHCQISPCNIVMSLEIEDITWWQEEMNFTFKWQERRIHIFELMCNLLYII